VGALVRVGGGPRNSGGVLAGGAVGLHVEDDGVSRQPFQVSNMGGTEVSDYHTDELVVAQEWQERVQTG